MMRAGGLITVRLGSTRLPRKAMRKVNGREIITYLIRRTKYFCSGSLDLYICTTTEPENDEFDELADSLGVGIFHGDIHNILKRHLQCARANNLDFVLNVDGDDILCNPDYMKKIVELAERRDCDVIKTEGLPFGTNSMGYYADVIEKTLDTVPQDILETGWGRVITDPSINRIRAIKAKENERLDAARMTLDYPEDFAFFTKVIEDLIKDRADVSQGEIIDYLKAHPEVVAINSGLKEEYWNNLNKSFEKEKGSSPSAGAS